MATGRTYGDSSMSERPPRETSPAVIEIIALSSAVAAVTTTVSMTVSPSVTISASTTPATSVKKERRTPPPPPPPVYHPPTPVLTGPGQQNITSYFQRTNGSKPAATPAAAPVKNNADAETGRKSPPIDEESQRGVFGWTSFGNVHIPYIFRQGAKFASVRIIERILLKKFLQALPTDVYSCTYIKSYYLTPAESKLLNDINRRHCDNQFGPEDFTTKDLVVQLSDVEQLHQFLKTCYAKLVDNGSGTSSSGLRIGSAIQSTEELDKLKQRCGFLRLVKDGVVNGLAVVPFVLRNDRRYVPLSYFEQGVESIKSKAEKLQPWELSYMKFCCKVANIKTDFLQEQPLLVLAVEDIMKCANDNKLGKIAFEYWWPPPSARSAFANNIKADTTASYSRVSQAAARTTSYLPTSTSSASLLYASKQSSPSLVNGFGGASAAAALPSVLPPQVPFTAAALTPLQAAGGGAPAASFLYNPSHLWWTAAGPVVSSAAGATRCVPAALAPRGAAPPVSACQIPGCTKCPPTPITYTHPVTSTITTQLTGLSSSPVAVQRPPPLLRVDQTPKDTTFSQQQQRFLTTALPRIPVPPPLYRTDPPPPSMPVIASVQSLAGNSSAAPPVIIANVQSLQQSAASSRLASALASRPVPVQVLPATGNAAAGEASVVIDLTNMNAFPTSSPESSLRPDIGGDVSPTPSATFLHRVIQDDTSLSLHQGKIQALPLPANHLIAAGKPAYRVEKLALEGHRVHSVNKEPFSFSAMLLVPLVEVITNIFPRVTVSVVQHVLSEVLNVQLYEANGLQVDAFISYGTSKISSGDKVLLVNATDLIQYMPQLRYMVKAQERTEPDPKRVRLDHDR